MGTIVITVLESHDLFDYFLFHLFLVCHVRFVPQQLGVRGQIDRLSIGRGLSSLSLVEDSVVSPLDPLGKKLSIDRSFPLRSAMTTYQQYCTSEHVLSIYETQTLIGSPYPIRWHDIIGSCYPEHFCRCKYKYTLQYKNQQRCSLLNSGGIGDFSTSFFFFIIIFCAKI